MRDHANHDWQHTADAMPQLICLLDEAGRVVHVNRTLERWDLGEAAQARGLDLHDVLHSQCSDPDCYLRRFWRRTLPLLSKDGRADCYVWDSTLKRQLEIRTLLPLAQADTDIKPFFAVVTIDDVSNSRTSADRSAEAAKLLNRRIEREVEHRVQTVRAQSRWVAIMDKAPVFTGIFDRTGKLFYLNQAGRTLMGLGANESLADLTLAECHAPQARDRIDQEALPAVEREGTWSGDSVLKSRDGREVRVHLTLLSHCDEHKQIDGFTLFGRDMSDWIRTEEALRVTQNEVWRLGAQHLTIQESERRRIAVDLHDGLGQTLSLVKLSIEEATRSIADGGSDKAVQALADLAPTVKLALNDLRRMAMNLRPSTLDDLGILATLSWYLREFESVCTEMSLQRDISVAETDVPELLKITIFRIVQEATSNALKHARANQLHVCLRLDGDALELLIEDNGQGFDPELTPSRHDFGSGLGLQSMKERTELSGGDYEFRASPGQGTRVRVRWPVQELMESSASATVRFVTPIPQAPVPADSRLSQTYSQCLACMHNQRNP